MEPVPAPSATQAATTPPAHPAARSTAHFTAHRALASVLRALHSGPRPAETRDEARRRRRVDAGIAGAVLVLQITLALLNLDRNGHRPDAFGWALLTVSAVALVGRRHSPMVVTAAVVLMVGPYHAMDNVHIAVVPAGLLAVYTLAVIGPPLRSFLTVGILLAGMVTMMTLGSNVQAGANMLRSSGWVLSVVVIGEAVRIHRKYIAAILERAERAERTREEEAARRVAEERLRIARDLHDLLAHSITLIGVQTSVAAHVLIADPERLDREAMAKALDAMADTCRDARAELRATLQVLRGGADGETGHADEEDIGPLPGLAGLSDLAAAAEAAGVRVDLTVGVEAAELSPAVGAAAYRIVQEALTNAVRHAPGTRVRITLVRDEGELCVAAVDDGPDGDGEPLTAPAEPGYGIVGMRERARSVAGSLTAGPREDGPGFAIRAALPWGRGGPPGGRTGTAQTAAAPREATA
ncbi:sensor histidine kinase [Streptomyces melanosporofaciens]|uniref:histidine kinase n=1 Tax=Streptomyces melanosporofaciens TaxID=67327 RepID=A0A1H4MY79_STRMJ|nr:sensor histidine kinase [Streptomyces melanosporofaciens]SEB87979.1 Signal transduction histidine kinase [Streptomyces melanosporofaciens]